MKRLLVIALCVAAAEIGYCVSQPQSLGLVTASTSTFTGSIGLWNRTAAQIAALVPSTTGQMLFCTNCTANGAAGTVCLSTGSTAVGQFALSTGTVCK